MSDRPIRTDISPPTNAEIAAHMRAGKLVVGPGYAGNDPILLTLAEVERFDPDEVQPQFVLVEVPDPRLAADSQPARDRRNEGKRRQTVQWSVIHHNQIRALRFGTFPVERMARASVVACTCGPHSLRRTVTTTYTATELVIDALSAATDPGEGEPT